MDTVKWRIEADRVLCDEDALEEILEELGISLTGE